MSTKIAKFFLKWAGGKTQLKNDIEKSEFKYLFLSLMQMLHK
jgi:hypothetical protein